MGRYRLVGGDLSVKQASEALLRLCFLILLSMCRMCCVEVIDVGMISSVEIIPGWLHLPLEAFLETVPADKVGIMAGLSGPPSLRRNGPGHFDFPVTYLGMMCNDGHDV